MIKCRDYLLGAVLLSSGVLCVVHMINCNVDAAMGWGVASLCALGWVAKRC